MSRFKIVPHQMASHLKQLSKRNKSAPRVTINLTIVLLVTVSIFFISSHSLAKQDQRARDSASSTTEIYLPIIAKVGALNPITSTTLSGGSYTFGTVVIPEGITVTITGDVKINVLGPVTIPGTLIADCFGIDLRGKDDITITGVIDNRCAGARTAAPKETTSDLVIQTEGGNMVLGSPDSPVTILSSGNITITNDPGTELWELILPPELRSDTPMPPVCIAAVDQILDLTDPNKPAEMRFYGWGIDPDGGPVDYAWDFDDGDSAGGKSPNHAYSASGVYDVVLTVTDDDTQTCMSSLRVAVEDEANAPEAPAVQLLMSSILAEVGEDIFFDALALDLQGDDLSHHLNFGDSTMTTTITSTHSYQATGRYEVTITVTDTNGLSSTATASVYVHPVVLLPALAADPQTPSNAACTSPLENGYQNNIGGQIRAGDGANGEGSSGGEDGKDIHISFSNPDLDKEAYVILPRTTIRSGDGGDSVDVTDDYNAFAKDGGDGGRFVLALPWGSLEKQNLICENVTLKAGDGGKAGNATAGFTDRNNGQDAKAFAGAGGNSTLFYINSGSAKFTGQNVVIDPGNGGNGGDAIAYSHSGDTRCPRGGDAGKADARSGWGGMIYLAGTDVRGYIEADADASILLLGGEGGDGGKAEAYGRKGGDASCSPGGFAQGGDGGEAVASASHGREGFAAKIWFSSLPWQNIDVDSEALHGGDSGESRAIGGYGGFASAVSNDGGTCLSREAIGGSGGDATSSAYSGARGEDYGSDGIAWATGGDGGYAEAIGDSCTGCGVQGGSAKATGGKGGAATAEHITYYEDLPPITLIRKGGEAGDAEAHGGDGGDCDQCPGGVGGDGGDAEAIGGDGGGAFGDFTITEAGGDGGDADALGGNGGDGAKCCYEPGGNGGSGGSATSNAGAAGEPYGSPGDNGIRGGHGGDGGYGKQPGSGGSGGVGTGIPADIPDGDPGDSGLLCPLIEIGHIDLSTLQTEDITPGATITLSTYITRDNTITPTGVVTLHLKTEEELGYPPTYEKTPTGDLSVLGGLEVDLPRNHIKVPIVTATLELFTPFTRTVVMTGYNSVIVVTYNKNVGNPANETMEVKTPKGEFFNRFVIVVTSHSAASFKVSQWGLRFSAEMNGKQSSQPKASNPSASFDRDCGVLPIRVRGLPTRLPAYH